MGEVLKYIVNHKKHILQLIIIFAAIVAIIGVGAASYLVVIMDGTLNESDPSNTPNAVSKHTSESVLKPKDDGTGTKDLKTKKSKDGGYALDFDIDVLTDEIIQDLNTHGGKLNVYFNKGNVHDYLKKMITAEYITQYPDLRKASKIGTSVPKGEFQGIVKFIRNGSDGVQEVLEYMPLGTEDSTDNDTLYGLINNANNGNSSAMDKVLSRFSIDIDGNLIIVNWNETVTKSATGEYSTEFVPDDQEADYSEQDRPNITNAPETIEYTYSPYKVNYKSVISKYTMPFNYLWAFLVCGRDQQFISDFADLVLNSSIEISIYDNLVEIQDETIEAYNNNYMESTRTWKRTLVNGSVSGEETMGDWTEPEVKSTTHNFDINYTKTYNNTIVIAATNIDIWYMKYAANYTYEVIDDGETKEITRLEPDPIASPSELITAGNVQFGEWKTTSTKTEPEWGTGAANIPVITGYKVTKNQEKVDKVFQNRKNQNTMTTFYHQIQYKYTLDGVPEVKEKTDPTLQEGDEGYPNFCTLYLKSKDERRNIDGVESWLFTIIESNADTVDMLELTKYLLYRATNKNFGVTELDFQSLYAPSDGFYDFSSIGDLDVSDESLFITDLEKLKEAFTGYSRSDKLVQYAQEFLDMQSKYKVNALFAAAVSITETGAGNAGNATKTANAQNSVGATAGQCWNNWFNVKTGSTPYGIVHNGEGESHYRIYAEVGDSINGFGDLIANGSYYYTQGRYTVNAIGHTYCPNSEAYPTQGDDWVKTTLQLINNFYSKVGMSVGAPTGGSSDEKLAYLFPDGIPTDQAGCSKYIQTITVALTTKDGTKTTGSLSIHKSLTADVQRVFQEAQDKGFKIYSAGGYSFRKMNNGGSGSLSHHSYGVAIDINVNENYSHRGSTVYAGSFWNPAKSEFSIPRDGVLVRAFAAIGWSWGGNWSGNYQDYMHFSYTGH